MVGRVVSALTLVGLFVVPVAARQGPPPRTTVGAQAVTFQAPLALWDPATNTVKLLYATKPLTPAQDVEARRARAWPSAGLGPGATVDLQFAPGTASGMVNDVVGCRLGFSGFGSAPVVVTGKAPDCHLISTGGRLMAGGMLIGLIEGKGRGYDARLPFSAMFPADAPAAPAVAAATTAAPVTATASRPAAPAIAPNTVSGSGTYTGQTLKFTHGLAWSGKNGIEIALFDHTPRANMLAELRTGSWGDGGPTATLTIAVEPGRVGPAAVSYCYVNLEFPSGGPMGLNKNNAAGCGLTEISGTFSPGGSILARLKGSAPMRDNKPMTWDLQFNLPIAK